MMHPVEFLKRFVNPILPFRGRLPFAICLIACEFQSSIAAAQEQSSPVNSLLGQVEVSPEGGLSFFTNYKGHRLRSFAITPAGSLIAGGVSAVGTPKTQVPPTKPLAEYDAVHDDERNWIHDLYFGRYEHDGGQPRLHTRGLIMWGRGDSPDVQMGRTGPDNAPTTYGPPEDTEPGSCLGKMIFTAWGQGQFQGDIAGVYARNDTVPTGERNPGSLHLGTAGESIGTAPEQKRNWRDMVDRIVITSRGYVGIGDGFANPAERLHVDGNVLSNANVIAKRDVITHGTIKIIADHAAGGKGVVLMPAVSTDTGIYFRGEGQLISGRAVIELPKSFESIAAKDGRTVQLTNVDGFDRLAVERQAGMQVANGRFNVVSENKSSSQAFSWQVTAKRANAE
jgi:hypothetical protein